VPAQNKNAQKLLITNKRQKIRKNEKKGRTEGGLV
jgi:hypothetical protein